MVHRDRVGKVSDFGIVVGHVTESLPVIVHAVLEEDLHLPDGLLAPKVLVLILDVVLCSMIVPFMVAYDVPAQFGRCVHHFPGLPGTVRRGGKWSAQWRALLGLPTYLFADEDDE